jgi:hypothetical protein
MQDLLAKLSSYNIFNYLLPGCVFAALAPSVAGYSFAQDNLFTAAFLYYFIGLVISRVGSLVVEPALKRVGFVKFAGYTDFVSASKTDPKIEVLSETNNTYRTACAMFGVLVLLKSYRRLGVMCPGLQEWDAEILVVVLFLLFLFSYRKQTAYITRRIKAKG